MKQFYKLKIARAVFLSILFFGFCAREAKASHAAGGEIAYQWVSDSTYRIYFKFYRFCSGAAEPANVALCWRNSCNSQGGTLTLTKVVGKLPVPDSATNGSTVTTGCGGTATKCTNPSSTIEGYREWWYTNTVKLPSRCSTWIFSTYIGNRNNSTNLNTSSNYLFYVEATLNNQVAQGNSSPYFTVKPVPYVCVNSPYTYNNGAVDPNSDSLVFDMLQPKHVPNPVTCTTATTNVPFANASPNPAYNTTTNPLQTNNSFVLSSSTGQMSFTPIIVGNPTITTRVREYRQGVLIGSVMRDVQVQVLNCSTYTPTVGTISGTIIGGTIANGRLEACAGVPMYFCFDAKSTDTSAVLIATDNHVNAAPGSSVTYYGQNTDSIRGCFSWTPYSLDTGLRIFTVSVKDSTCKPPGIAVTQTFVLPIYIWPITAIVDDTIMCLGDSARLLGVGGKTFTWSVLSGGSGISSLSCTTCKEPYVKPTTTTKYVVLADSNVYCTKSRDTATVTVVDYSATTPYTPGAKTPLCSGDTLELYATSQPGWGYKWTGPNGFLSTKQNPDIPNATVNMSGYYLLRLTQYNCPSSPDSVEVQVDSTPVKPVVTDNGPVCAGSTLTVSATSATAGVSYSWTGPNSFTSSAQNPTVTTNAQSIHAGIYTATAALGDCSSSDTTHVTVKPVPAISSTGSSNPTTCSGTQGSITLNGLTASTSYTVNYRKNGVAQTPLSLSSNGSGIITMSSLGAGVYSRMTVTLNGCVSDTTAPVTLSDPTPPTISLSAANNPTTCLGTDGSIVVGGLTNGLTYTVNYSKNAVAQTPLSLTANASGNVTIPNLPAASYTLVKVTINNCTSNTLSTIVLSDPTPPSISVNKTNPSTCGGSNGFITISGLTNGSNYSVSYDKNSVPQTPFAQVASSGSAVIANLAIGTYSNIKVTNSNCTSNTAGPLTLTSPAAPVISCSNNGPLCPGDTVKLFGSSDSSSVTWAWTGPGSYSSSLQNPKIDNGQPVHTGTYSATASKNNCTSSVASTVLTVNSTPATPTTSSNSPVCSGNNINLTASTISGATYQWTGPNSFVSSSQNPTITNVDTQHYGQYIVRVFVNNCGSVADTETVIVYHTPSIASSSSSNPTTCNGTQGTITLNGLLASSVYNVNFKKNGTTQTPVAFSTNGSGTLVMTGLNAGTYSQIRVELNGCYSDTVNPFTLIDPTPPSIVFDTSVSPSVCAGTNGYFTISGLTNGINYSINYTKNSVAQTPVSLTANSSGKVTVTGLGAGVYNNITASLNNCPSNAVGMTLLSDPNPPSVSANNNTPICQGDTIKLFATGSGGATFSWSGPGSYSSTNQNPVILNSLPAQSGTYTVTAALSGCTASTTTSVTVKPTPATPNATNNGPLCIGDTIRLNTDTVSGSTYSWTGPLSFTSTSQAPVINNVDTTYSGPYIVYRTVNGCVSAKDTTDVAVNHIPAIASTSYADPTTCVGTQGSITLNGLRANTTYTVNFKKNGVSQSSQSKTTNGSGSLTVTGLGAGNYTAITATLNSCTSPAAGPVILSDPSPPVVTVSSNLPICEGDTIKLSASSVPGVTYSWTGPNSYTSSAQNPIIINSLPSHSGNYSVTGTLNNCTSAPVTTTVLVKPTPATPTAGSNTPLCAGSTLHLTATTVSGASYSWTGPASFTSSSQNPDLSNADTLNSGAYLVIAIVNGCPSLPDTENVIVHHVPAIASTSFTDPVTCNGTEGSITLTGLRANTTYTVNYKRNNVTQTPLSIATNSSGNLIMTALGAGVYTAITVTLNNCTSASAPMILLSDPTPPTISVTPVSPSTCSGTEGKLIISGLTNGSSYSVNFTKNGITQSPLALNAAAGAVAVTGLNAATYDSISVTISNCTSNITGPYTLTDPLAPVINATNNTPICQSATVNLTATADSAGVTWSWTGPNSFSSAAQNPSIATALPAHSGNYILNASKNNCVALTDTTFVLVKPTPDTPDASNNSPLCAGDNLVLLTSAVTNASYTWTGPNSFTDTNQSPILLGVDTTQTGTYSIVVTVDGCPSAVRTTNVIIYHVPQIASYDSTNPTVCSGTNGSITLKGLRANTAYDVSYSKDGIGQPLAVLTSNGSGNILISSLNKGNYSNIRVTLNGCISPAIGPVVLVDPETPVVAASNNTPLCQGTTVNLSASGTTGVTWSWTGPNSFTSTSQNPSILSPNSSHSGIYTVTVTKNSCVSAPASTFVLVKPTPATPVAANNGPLCAGDTLLLTSTTVTNASYGWTGPLSYTSSNQNPVINGTDTFKAGNYIVVATVNGCPSAADTTNVIIYHVPQIASYDSTNPSTCNGTEGSITLKGLIANTTYTVNYWKNGIAQTPLSLTSTAGANLVMSGLGKGTYSSITITLNGCTSDLVGPIILADPATPVVNASNNTPICQEGTVNLFASGTSGVTWSWTGPNSFTSTSQNPSITTANPSHSGTYIVTVSKNNCTSIPASTSVLVKPTPATPVAANNGPLCAGDTLLLTSTTVTNASYDWTGPLSYASSNQNPAISGTDTFKAGNYIVIATVDGCPSAADTTNVIIYHVPQIASYDSTHPSTCNGTEGSITLKGLIANTTYTVNYWKNGIAQTPLSLTSNASANILMSGLGKGTYSSITITLNGCTSALLGPIILVDPATPVVNASNNTPICQESTVNFFASGTSGVTWSWTGPNSFTSTLQSPVIATALPMHSGTYTVVVTKNNCPSLPATTTVLVKPTPPTPVAGSNDPLCSGNTLVLTADTITNASYSWTGPSSFTSTSQNPYITNTDTSHSGAYIVYVTVDACVSAKDTAFVTVYQTPAPVIGSFSVTNPTTCGGTQGSISLSGLVHDTTYTVNYFKNGLPQIPVSVLTTSIGGLTINNLGAGFYSNITVKLGICSSDPIGPATLFDPLPPVISASNGTPICQEDTIALFASSAATGVSWSWTGPGGFTSSVQNPTILNALPSHSGTYSLTGTKNNCTSAPVTTTVLVYPTPAAPVSGSNSPVCSGDTLRLTALFMLGATYYWDGPLSFTSNAQNPAIGNVDTTHSGQYTVFVTVNGCISPKDTADVVVNHTPAIGGFTSKNPTNCNGTEGTITLTGLMPSKTYIVNYVKNGVAGSAVSLSSNASGNLTIPGLGAGSYSSITVARNGCTSPAVGTAVLIDPSAPVVTAGNNTPICQADTIKLMATADSSGVTLSWTGPNSYTSSAQNPMLLNALPSQSGVYYVTATVHNCTSNPDSTIVVVKPTPTTPVATNNGPLCYGDTLKLTSSTVTFPAGTTTYAWTGPNTFTSTLQNPVIANADTQQNGTYVVRATVNGCVSFPGSTVVTVYHISSIASLSSTNPTTCSGTQGTITLTGLKSGTTYTVNYNKNGTPQTPVIITANSSGNVIITGLGAGLYATLRVSWNGCTSNSVGPVTLSDPLPPTISASNNTPVCENDTIRLFATGVAGISWSWTGPNGFTSTIQNPVIAGAQLTQAGTYYVTGTLNNCISNPASTTVVIKNTPTTPVASSNSPVCSGGTLSLSSSTVSFPAGGTTYAWTGPLSFTSGLQNPSIANADTFRTGTYTVIATVNGCKSAPGTVNVIVYDYPKAPITTPVTYCQYDTAVALTAVGQNLLWYIQKVGGTGSSTAPVPQTFTPGAMVWWVSQTINGCEGFRDSILVTVKPLPSKPTVNPPTYIYCEQDNPVQLSATGTALKWYLVATGGIGSTIAPYPPATSAGVYFFYVTQTVNGCESFREVITVTVKPKPVPPVVVTPILYCADDNAKALNATGQSLLWYLTKTGGVGSTFGPIPVTTATGSTKYYVSQTINGCESDRDSIEVIVNPKVIANIVLEKDTVCRYDTVSLNNIATNPGSATYNWGFDGGTIIVGSDPGPYQLSWETLGVKTITVTITNLNCTATDTARVFIVPAPDAAFILGNKTMCAGDKIEIIPDWNYDLKYRWTFDNGIIKDTTSFNTYHISWNDAGEKTISLVTIDKYGCESKPFSDKVLVHGLPVADINHVSKDDICTGDTVIVSAKMGAGYTYEWSPSKTFITNGSAEVWMNVYHAGPIYLKVTDMNKCVASDSMHITAEPCCDVSLPTAFTPNADGRNDIFRIMTVGHHAIKRFIIVNRWGQVVFETKDENKGWDGSFSGVPQDIGVYYYYLQYECSDNTMLDKKGEIMLIR